MGSIWTVRPETDRIDLTFVDADGAAHPFTITVKRRLSVGEARKVATAGWRGLKQGGGEGAGAEINIDWKLVSFARVEAYLTAWSLTDDEGRLLPLTREMLEAMHPAVYALVEDAINDHIARVEQEKKLPSGDASSSATSA